jgi:hypothetical protein
MSLNGVGDVQKVDAKYHGIQICGVGVRTWVSRSFREALNNRHLPSLRAFKPLAARPKAVAGSNPVLCFSEHSGLL